MGNTKDVRPPTAPPPTKRTLVRIILELQNERTARHNARSTRQKVPSGGGTKQGLSTTVQTCHTPSWSKTLRTYFPTKFSRTLLLPALWPPMTAICGRSSGFLVPSCENASWRRQKGGKGEGGGVRRTATD